MVALFARLKHELDSASKLISLGAQHFGGTDQHRNMGVMATRMHRTFGQRAIFKAGILMEWQRVHIAA